MAQTTDSAGFPQRPTPAAVRRRRQHLRRLARHYLGTDCRRSALAILAILRRRGVAVAS